MLKGLNCIGYRFYIEYEKHYFYSIPAHAVETGFVVCCSIVGTCILLNQAVKTITDRHLNIHDGECYKDWCVLHSIDCYTNCSNSQQITYLKFSSGRSCVILRDSSYFLRFFLLSYNNYENRQYQFTFSKTVEKSFQLLPSYIKFTESCLNRQDNFYSFLNKKEFQSANFPLRGAFNTFYPISYL